MSERYHIEEILSQDELGVLFRAVDQESGRTVALRRFFPFGRDGGGLEEHETAEYRSAVGQLASLSDPALRQVLDGGCDPVDGMPYLVTEWVDGEALDALLTRGECEPDAVVDLLDRALALCMVISAKLGTEAVWLDTSPAMVVLDGGEGGRGVTFSISAIRWLVETRDRKSFEPLAVLAEEMMGWRGRLVGDQAGGGLGGWIKWTRNNGLTATQAEARLVLARMTGRAAAEPVPQVIAPPAVAAPPSAKRRLAADGHTDDRHPTYFAGHPAAANGTSAAASKVREAVDCHGVPGRFDRRRRVVGSDPF